MISDTPGDELITKLADLEEETVLALVRQRLRGGEDPLALIQACQRGMQQVGERYAAGEYFLAGLIMAGEIFREVMELVQPVLEQRKAEPTLGRVLVGTVQGDIHDIGKNMFSTLLSCYGFTVIDLGVDVPPDEFVAKTIAARPDIVGLSGLLTIAYDSMRETIAALRWEAAHQGLSFPVIIGGGRLDERVCRYVGADYWVTDAMEGVRLCQRLLGEQPPG
ncbi:MAG TPA: cobalamin-dependent protein [Anaerolineae bacterium]|nr:cobalamin-dependent protein [Anaerolineae bacterium]